MKEIQTPLLPGYVFCRFDYANRFPVVSAPGVVEVVSVAKMAAAVDDAEVAAMEALAASGLVVGPWPFLRAGERVLIERGPLAGIEGILVSVKGSCRLVASIELLQRSIAAEIDRGWVRPAGRRRAGPGMKGTS